LHKALKESDTLQLYVERKMHVDEIEAVDSVDSSTSLYCLYIMYNYATYRL